MPDGWCDGGGSRGGGGKVYPSRAGGDTARGRPVGGPGDRAGLPGCADAARSRAAAGAVARVLGRPPHSRPAPGSRTHRWRTPSRTPPRGSAPCATARRGRSRRSDAPRATGDAATGWDGGDRPTGGEGRRRASRGAAITRTRMPTPSRSHVIETRGTRACLDEDLGRRVPRSSPGQAYRSRAARRDTALHGDVCWHGRCASRVSVGSRRPRRHTQPGVPRDTGGATSRRPPQLKKGGPFLLAIPTCPGFPAWGVRTPAFDSRPAGVRRPARRCSSCPRAPARPAVPLPGNAQTDDKPARSPCGLCRRPAATASATNAAGALPGSASIH